MSPRAKGLAVALALVATPLGSMPSVLHAAPPQSGSAATAEPRAERRPGDRMVRAGVGVTVSGLLGYGLMAAGLAIGNIADSDLLALTGRDDIEARRDIIARGRLGNRLAIAGAVTATAALAVGIPLIVFGRRRHEASAPRAVVLVGGAGGGFGLRLHGRF